MNDIILADDDLRYLEKHFGHSVRHMDPWNSDGTFGYCSVPLAAVEKAADVINDSALSESVQPLKEIPETTRFIDMLQKFGGALIEKIVAVHQEQSPMRLPISRERNAANVA